MILLSPRAQIFTSKSAEFREAVAPILGVKLVFYPNGQVRVTSQFDLNAAFVFQPTHSSAPPLQKCINAHVYAQARPQAVSS